MTSAEVLAAVAATDYATRRCYYSYLWQMAMHQDLRFKEGDLEYAYTSAVQSARDWRKGIKDSAT